MNLKAGLVGRVVLPGDVDPAAGHGDDVGVGWGVRGRWRQRRRAGGVREVGVARPAVCPLERADLVTVLRRRVEPEVAPGSDTGGRRGHQRERPVRAICGAMDLEAGLVGRVVLPGDVDPAVGHGDGVGVRGRVEPGGLGRRRGGELDRLRHVEAKEDEQEQASE